VKYAIEPAHEATFHTNSYGFRPGRSAHDAQKNLFENLRSQSHGIEKRVIELDIEKCFDRISHTAIMERLISPKRIKTGIFRCLKAGINPEFPEQGTPQGGVVSPLLANIALNGIESIHKYKDPWGHRKEPSIRYADDMVLILHPNEDATKILDKISQFLAERGMKVSEKKTKLTATTNGFDFLGWHFKVQNNGKFRCVPSADNFNSFRKKVKTIVNSSKYGAEEKAKKLAPLVRGWRRYHRYCRMRGKRFALSSIRDRTFRVFNKETKQNRLTSKELLKEAFPAVPNSENKHNKVKGNKTPFDGDMTYWSKRNSKLYDGNTPRAINRQNHTGGYCGQKLLSEENVHLHHIDGNHRNWSISNLQALHESCHDYIHMSKSES